MSASQSVWAALALCTISAGNVTGGQEQATYAERLGWPRGTRVVIFHVDDAGMSYDSNMGAIRALEQGVATSTSIMMPCPWVPQFAAWVQEHPQTDAGVHLTLNAEWKNYRWGPVAGRSVVPGLTDPHGYLWHGVEEAVAMPRPTSSRPRFGPNSTRPWPWASSRPTSTATWAPASRCRSSSGT